ncbi:MAG: methyltransferase domain-containing protein [Bacteroidota bacterium]|nr:methyltransferase domain-containing protein [Bacteroidota bacterium]
MGLEDKSYKIHEQSFINTEVEKELGVYKNWFDNPTTDLWRHKRMLSVLDPFLHDQKGASWLTIGDGRFGTSAIYINRNGGKALATDIDTKLLDVAKQNNMITDFAYANAEKLPFTDEQFDFSYCKQAYHHFPRPILAVYEMLRVSKHAVIFTEPRDFIPIPIIRKILQKIKHGLKNILNKKIDHHDTGNYETIGNYVYTISIREFEKIALGLGLPCIAYKDFHDIYLKGVENELFSKDAKLYKKIDRSIVSNQIETSFGLTNPNTIQAIIFKTIPAANIISSLKKDGYTFVSFSPNPYI